MYSNLFNKIKLFQNKCIVKGYLTWINVLSLYLTMYTHIVFIIFAAVTKSTISNSEICSKNNKNYYLKSKIFYENLKKFYLKQ